MRDTLNNINEISGKILDRINDEIKKMEYSNKSEREQQSMTIKNLAIAYRNLC